METGGIGFRRIVVRSMRPLANSILLFITGCGAFAGMPDAAQIDSITLERTACFGSCPVYSVTVRRDGTVSYKGESFVRVKGRRSRRISSSDFQQLADEVCRIGFFGFEDEYVLKDKYADGRVFAISDMPSAITTVQAGKLQKSVNSNDDGCRSGVGPDAVVIGTSPEGLRRLEALIDKISGSAKWVGKGT